jgi:hypothetical protein
VWSACNVTCGGGGQWRVRSPGGALYGGQPCNGSAVDTQTCANVLCPSERLARCCYLSV